ncbi:DNA replication terminus site-binding protein [Sulfurimonas sp.]
MVKILISLLLLHNIVYADEFMNKEIQAYPTPQTNEDNITMEGSFLEEVEIKEDPLTEKIKSFLNTQTYEKNKAFINVIFDPKSSFYDNDRVNAVKVVQTLKENGLLKLFFKSPQEFQLNFKTSGSPLFFVKIMGDTLRNIGYYRYVTTASNLSSSEFTWSIKLTSEYATDPLILQQELKKSGCEIIDIERKSKKDWTYVIDMLHGKLNIKALQADKELRLKRSLYAHWLNVSNIKKLRIVSSRRNSWYPYIAYYDASLHLVKLIKRDKISRDITLKIPKNANYVKISDLYTLKNVRDELTLKPTQAR